MTFLGKTFYKVAGVGRISGATVFSAFIYAMLLFHLVFLLYRFSDYNGQSAETIVSEYLVNDDIRARLLEEGVVDEKASKLLSSVNAVAMHRSIHCPDLELSDEQRSKLVDLIWEFSVLRADQKEISRVCDF